MTDDKTNQQYKQRHLRFLHKEILEDDREWTLRVDFERDLNPGNKVALIDEGGYTFAYARVEMVIISTVLEIFKLDLDGYPSFEYVADLVGHLGMYYGSTPLGASSDCTAIKLTQVREV